MGAHDGSLSIFRTCNPNIGVPRRFAMSRCGTPIFGLHALRGLSNCHLASPFQATLHRPCAPITFMLDHYPMIKHIAALIVIALIFAGCGSKKIVIIKSNVDQIVTLYRIDSNQSISHESSDHLTLTADFSAGDSIGVSAKDVTTGKTAVRMVDTQECGQVTNVAFAELFTSTAP